VADGACGADPVTSALALPAKSTSTATSARQRGLRQMKPFVTIRVGRFGTIPSMVSSLPSFQARMIGKLL
jgi:hypothetical protein